MLRINKAILYFTCIYKISLLSDGHTYLTRERSGSTNTLYTYIDVHLLPHHHHQLSHSTIFNTLSFMSNKNRPSDIKFTIKCLYINSTIKSLYMHEMNIFLMPWLSLLISTFVGRTLFRPPRSLHVRAFSGTSFRINPSRIHFLRPHYRQNNFSLFRLLV